MLLKLFLAFTLIPVAEIYLLVKVGEYVGALNTVGLVILTGLAGATLARVQGLHALERIRVSLLERRVPSRELMDAALILVAGVLLLAPGFLTDAVGIALLLPPGRAAAARYLIGMIRRRVGGGRVFIDVSSPDDR
jgi:UPF0716 protein FxsA